MNKAQKEVAQALQDMFGKPTKLSERVPKMVYVLNKKTLDLENVFEDVVASDPGNYVVDPDLTLVRELPKDLWKVEDGKVVPASVEDTKAYYAAQLRKAQEAVASQLDTKADREVTEGPGFEWPADSGNFFSLSLPAQVKWMGLFLAKDAMEYPMTVTTKDGLTAYEISGPEEVAHMFLTAVATVNGAVQAATEAKEEVRDAKDLKAVSALVKGLGRP